MSDMAVAILNRAAEYGMTVSLDGENLEVVIVEGIVSEDRINRALEFIKAHKTEIVEHLKLSKMLDGIVVKEFTEEDMKGYRPKSEIEKDKWIANARVEKTQRLMKIGAVQGYPEIRFAGGIVLGEGLDAWTTFCTEEMIAPIRIIGDFFDKDCQWIVSPAQEIHEVAA